MPERLLARLAERFGCTEERVVSLLVGAALAVALAATGLPPVLRTDPVDGPRGPSTDAPATHGEPDDLAAGSEPPPRTAATPAADGAEVQPPPAPDGPPPPESSADAGADAGQAPTSFVVLSRTPTLGVAMGQERIYLTTTSTAGEGQVLVLDEDGRNRELIALRDGATAGRPIGGIAVVGDALLVTEPDRGRVTRLVPKTAAQETAVIIPDVPPCILLPAVVAVAAACEPGTTDRRPLPLDVAARADGTAFVTDPAQASVWVAGAQGDVRSWLTSPALGGERERPVGVAVAGRTVYVTTETAKLFAVPISDDGSAGAPAQLAAFAAGDHPSGVDIAESGDVYVALGVGFVGRVSPEGAQLPRVPVPDFGSVTDVGVASGRTLIVGPRGAAFLSGEVE